MEAIKIKTKEKTSSTVSISVKKAKQPFLSLFKAINANTVLPILEDILITRRDGCTEFSATDLENILSIEMPDSGDDAMFLFPGRELRYLVYNSISDVVDILVSDNSGQPKLTAKNGRFKLEIQADKISDYPKPVEFKSDKKLTIDTKELLPFLGNAIPYMSRDDLRPSMTGVCFKDWKGMINIVATDAHRLYWHPICKTPAEYKGCEFIVSRKAVQLIIELFKTEKTISIEIGNPHLKFSNDGKSLITRPIDVRYPDFAQVIPTTLPLSLHFSRTELIQALTLCQHFTNKSTQQLVINLSPDKAELSGGDNDFAIQFSHSIPVKKTNIDTFAPYLFGVNCKFLLQALSCSKDELVLLQTEMMPLKAMIVDRCILIMPLMINQ
jgi:DNA polymerase III subunit beta